MAMTATPRRGMCGFSLCDAPVLVRRVSPVGEAASNSVCALEFKLPSASRSVL